MKSTAPTLPSGFLTHTLVLVAAFGCSGVPADRGAPATRTTALNGNISFDEFTGPRCSSEDGMKAFRSKFQKAMDEVLVPWIVTNPGPMLACVKDAILSGQLQYDTGQSDDVRFPEDIMALLAENTNTTILCRDDLQTAAGGPTCGSGGGEVFVCDDSTMDSPVIELAALMLHEIAHKAFNHPGGTEEYQHSPLQQAALCLTTLARGASSGAPFGTARSLLGSAETTLAQVGRALGAPMSPTYCDTNQFLWGFHGASDGAQLNSLGAVCRTLVTPTAVDFPAAGGSTGTRFRTTCLADEVAVGATGKADSTLRSIGNVCAREVDVKNGLATSRVDSRVGGDGGSNWQRICPPFQALKGVRLRTGTLPTPSAASFVHRLELMCEDIRDGLAFDQSALPRAGGIATSYYFETCQSRAIIKGLAATIDPSGTFVGRLGGRCANVWTFGTPSPASGQTHLMPSHGGAYFADGLSGTIDHVDSCPSGKALVGLRTHVSGETLVGVQGRCAEIEAWSNGTTTAQSDLPLRGIQATEALRTCPSQRFLVGWFVDADQRVRGVTPICRKFPNSLGGLTSEVITAALNVVLAP